MPVWCVSISIHNNNINNNTMEGQWQWLLEHNKMERNPGDVVKPVSPKLASIEGIKVPLDCRNCNGLEITARWKRANMFFCHCIVCGYSWRALFPRRQISDLVLALEKLQDSNSNKICLSLQQEVQSDHFE